MRHTPSAAREHTEVARLTQELNEALEQQSVTSELLGIISSGVAELEPIRASMMTRWGPSIDGMLKPSTHPATYAYAKGEQSERAARMEKKWRVGDLQPLQGADPRATSQIGFVLYDETG
jgi:hypothetical protein